MYPTPTPPRQPMLLRSQYPNAVPRRPLVIYRSYLYLLSGSSGGCFSSVWVYLISYSGEVEGRRTLVHASRVESNNVSVRVTHSGGLCRGGWCLSCGDVLSGSEVWMQELACESRLDGWDFKKETGKREC
jgi:hypothetical protein